MENIDEIKLAIYESYEDGEITEEEKDMLLDDIEERFNDDEYISNNLSDLEESVFDAIDSYEITFMEGADILLEAGENPNTAKSLYVEDIKDTIENIKERIDNGNEYSSNGQFILAAKNLLQAKAMSKKLYKNIEKTDIAFKDEPSLKEDALKIIARAFISSSIVAGIHSILRMDSVLESDGKGKSTKASKRRLGKEVSISAGIAAGASGLFSAYDILRRTSEKKNNYPKLKASLLKTISQLIKNIDYSIKLINLRRKASDDERKNEKFVKKIALANAKNTATKISNSTNLNNNINNNSSIDDID